MLKRMPVTVMVTGIVLCDQISKIFANRHLVLHEPKVIVEHLNLTLVYNRGAAFGFLSEAGSWNRWFFVVLTICIVLFLIHLLKGMETEHKSAPFAIALIIGGALGNLADRIWWGHVIDFVDIHYFGYHWPAFNVADSAITAGALGLLFFAFRGSKNESPSR